MIQTDNTSIVKFHFYSLKFTPYKDVQDSHSSKTILKDVITYLTKKRNEGQGHLIDRNQGKMNEDRRELFMTSAVFMHKERKIRCSIALLRAGRKPKLKPKDKYRLIPITDMGSIAEETHFFIDFSRNTAVICLEYNYYGPRISDIEYYLRNVARDTLRLSRATEVNLYMDSSIDKTLKELKNVLNLDIKIQPSNLKQIDDRLKKSYFSGLDQIGDFLKPKYLKLEALYQTSGKTVESSEINNSANSMVLDLLRTFKGRPFNIDVFENFVVKYENKEGQEDIFNLLKGKKEIVKEINLTEIT